MEALEYKPIDIGDFKILINEHLKNKMKRDIKKRFPIEILEHLSDKDFIRTVNSKCDTIYYGGKTSFDKFNERCRKLNVKPK